MSGATPSAARRALRTQKGLADRVIRVRPKVLLVPPAPETDVNPFAGALWLVVEPRLSRATRWYVTTHPAEIDGLEYV